MAKSDKMKESYEKTFDDLRKGSKELSDAENMLKNKLKAEEYLECAGIRDAINDYKELMGVK